MHHVLAYKYRPGHQRSMPVQQCMLEQHNRDAQCRGLTTKRQYLLYRRSMPRHSMRTAGERQVTEKKKIPNRSRTTRVAATSFGGTTTV